MNEMTAVSTDSIAVLNDDVNQYLSFILDGETYGVSILVIKEILEYSEPTKVPMMPGFIRGVINLRGNVLPVVDLSLRLGKKETGIAKRTCVVIVEVQCGSEGMEVGVVVDAVNEVMDIEPGNIESAPSFGTKIRNSFIQGMGKVGDKFVVLLNIERVLSIEELSQVEEVKQS